MRRLAFLCFGIAAAVPVAAAHATLGQSTTPSGDAFVSSCAGNGFGGIGDAGDAISGGTSFSIGSPPGVEAQTCSSQMSPTPGASVTTSQQTVNGTNFGNIYNNNSSATASLTTIHTNASNSGDTDTQFAGAAAQGGFNQTFTPMGGTIGTQGILPVHISVDGTLIASGPGSGGSALLEVEMYENNNRLQPYNTTLNQTAYNDFTAANSAFNPTTNSTQVGEGNVFFSWDYQMKPYEVVWNAGDPGSETELNVSETVTFFLPVTWGTPIEVGLYGLSLASEAANGASAGPNSSTSDFQNTITWAGVGEPLNANGSPSGITDFTLDTSSGINYVQSFVPAPEPGGLAVLGAGLAGLARLRDRRRGRGTGRSLMTWPPGWQ